MLLRTAIAEGVEYVDLEDDIAGKIPRFGKTKRIDQPPRFPQDARQPGGDPPPAVRAGSGHHQDLHHGQPSPRQPADPATGRGRARCPPSASAWATSACRRGFSAGRFGSPFTYATFHHERALAPGQLSFQQMTEIYHYDQINAQTEVYGVIADPVGHSLSPQIHNAAFAQLKLNKVYVPFRVPREDLPQFIDDAPAWGIQGLSVTIPHKEEIVKLLTEADGAVRGIGAANTVVFRGRRPQRLQHRLPRRHEQPGRSRRNGRPGEERKRNALKARPPWCWAPAAWAWRSPTACAAAARRWSSPTASPGRPTCWPSGSIAAPSTGRCGTP